MRPPAPRKKISMTSISQSSAVLEEVSGVGRCLALPVRQALHGPLKSLEVTSDGQHSVIQHDAQIAIIGMR